MRDIRNLVKSDSGEKLLGEDKDGVAVVECTQKVNLNVREDRLDSKASGKYWFVCPECGNTCWREVNGSTYYHLLLCTQSNGIGYNEERIEDVNDRLATMTRL